MHSSTSHYDQPVPLSKIRAYYHAWYVVRNGMPLDEFLRWRRRLYQSLYRRSHYPLLFAIVIENRSERTIRPFAHQDF